MDYNKTQVYGKLFAGTETYWIVSPHPEILDNLWDELLHTAFFGVNCEKYGQEEWAVGEYRPIYPVPYAIVVSGTWHIELRPPVGDGCIWCEKPSLLEESVVETESEEYDTVELIGDMVRSDDYRFINGEFEEEDWNEEDLEDAELEEEEILVEEG